MAALVAPATATAELPDRFDTGVNLTAWTARGYDDVTGRLEAARAAGATSVTLVPTLQMATPDANAITRHARATPTDEGILRAAEAARRLGLRVTLKPHVDVAANHAYRGHIRPSDPSAWFASYGTEVVDHYATLAERAGASRFVVGTELDSMTVHADAWRTLIERARARFHGELTYAANWDAFEHVAFWDALDVIGIDAYVPLGTADSSVDDLAAAWQPFFDRVAALHERTGRPVAFTELGYQHRSVHVPGQPPPEGDRTAETQARRYDAALRVWSRAPWFHGISWWSWSAQPQAGSVDDSFSPEGRAAEAVVRRFTGVASAHPSGGGDPGVALAILALALAACAAFRLTPAGTTPRGRPYAWVGSEVERSLHSLLYAAVRATGAHMGAIFVVDAAAGEAVALARVGLTGRDGTRIGLDRGVTGHAARTGHPILVSDYAEAMAGDPGVIRRPLESALAVPAGEDGIRVVLTLATVRLGQRLVRCDRVVAERYARDAAQALAERRRAVGTAAPGEAAEPVGRPAIPVPA